MKKEKIYNLLLYVIMFLYIVSIILQKPINDLDELWNYNFARNIADGLVPYRDFNMVITPLLSIICGIVLKITLNELIVMRILAALLCSLMIYMVYKLLRMLNIEKSFCVICAFGVAYLFKNVYCLDYNFASLLLVLIIIYKEIQYYKKDEKFIKENLKEDVLLGVLAGLSVTTKQTSGLFICFAVLGNKLIFVRKKDEFKIYFKSFLYRLIGMIIPILLLVLYLVITNAFFEFISYTIKGISEFSNKIPYKTLIGFNVLGVLSIFVPIMFIYLWIRTIILEKDKIQYIFLVYGLGIFVVCFPISNEIHFLIGALPIIIIILYEVYNLFKRITKYEKINKVILSFLEIFIILFLIYTSAMNLYNYYSIRESYSTLNHFKYIPINKDLEKEIKKVNMYILENKDIKILDSSAAIYMIPIDRYNKDFDMFNKGNFGANGEKRIIQNILESKGTKFLILNDKYSKNWQTPLDIIDFVKINKTKTGKIKIFDIYE